MPCKYLTGQNTPKNFELGDDLSKNMLHKCRIVNGKTCEVTKEEYSKYCWNANMGECPRYIKYKIDD